MGKVRSRSPSPETLPPPVPPPPPDTQELQINAILQGIAAENNHTRNTHRTNNYRKRKLSSKSEPVLPAPPQPPPPALPSRKEMSEIKQHNLGVRANVYKAIRRPGRDFTHLFEQLKQLRGSVDMKKEVLRQVIDESLRFKRKGLAKLLEDFITSLEKNGNSVSLKREINSTLAYSSANSHS